ncbi:MAG: hypothetical protein KBC64_07280 [Simkaniaceae bacterium]|nr:hypothetical protein [Simkaniaceae bacterium]
MYVRFLFYLWVAVPLFGDPFQGWTLFSIPLEGSSETALTAEYKGLRSFAFQEKIKKIVYLVRYDEAIPFFHPDATKEESLVRLLSLYPLPAGCTLELMFDASPCSYRAPKRGRVPDHDVRTHFTFRDLQQKLDYFAEMHQRARGIITGIVIDPQEMILLNDIQKVINYTDAYLHLNSLSHYIKKGILLPIDQEMFTFLNRSTLPVKATSVLGQWAQKKGIEVFPLGERPLWRKNDPGPLMDHIYVNVCCYPTPSLFETIALDPSQGAQSFLSLLTKTPYKKGQGVLKFSQGGKEICGKETAFISEVIPGTPIAVELNEERICLCIDKSQPTPPHLWMSCGASVAERPQSNTLLKLDKSSSLASNGYVPYYVVEALVNYRMIPITYEMAEGITWVFNFQPRFFGRYSRKTLAQFMQALRDKGKNFGVFKGVSQSALPFFPEFALFAFEDMH